MCILVENVDFFLPSVRKLLFLAVMYYEKYHLNPADGSGLNNVHPAPHNSIGRELKISLWQDIFKFKIWLHIRPYEAAQDLGMLKEVPRGMD